MSPKRLRRKKPGVTQRLLQPPETPEPEPLKVTCPGCGATAELTDHSCPSCGQLFYERRRGHVGRQPAGTPRGDDPDIAQFAQRMEQTEKWTRVICTIAGVILGILAVVCIMAVSAFPIVGSRAAIMGAFVCVVAAIACLQRGLGRRGRDVDGLGRKPR